MHGQVLLLDAHLSLRVAVAGWVSEEELKGNYIEETGDKE